MGRWAQASRRGGSELQSLTGWKYITLATYEPGAINILLVTYNAPLSGEQFNALAAQPGAFVGNDGPTGAVVTYLEGATIAVSMTADLNETVTVTANYVGLPGVEDPQTVTVQHP